MEADWIRKAPRASWVRYAEAGIRLDPIGWMEVAAIDRQAVRRRLELGDGPIVAYLPTHRAFGRGALSPHPFAESPERLAALRALGVRVAVKLHPSMLAAGAPPPPTAARDVLVDVSHACQDPQELLAVADLLLFDPGQPWVVDREQLRSRSKNSPFDEQKLQGRVLKTMVAGRMVYQYGS